MCKKQNKLIKEIRKYPTWNVPVAFNCALDEWKQGLASCTCQWQSKPKFSNCISSVIIVCSGFGLSQTAPVERCSCTVQVVLEGLRAPGSSAQPWKSPLGILTRLQPLCSVTCAGSLVAAGGVGCLIKIGLVEWSHLPAAIVPAAAVDVWLSAPHPGIPGIRKPWEHVLQFFCRGCSEKKSISSNGCFVVWVFFLPKLCKISDLDFNV